MKCNSTIETKGDFWEYLERFREQLEHRCGVIRNIVIPEDLKKAVLEKYPSGTITLGDYEIPICVSNDILVEESPNGCIATEIWVVGGNSNEMSQVQDQDG